VAAHCGEATLLKILTAYCRTRNARTTQFTQYLDVTRDRSVATRVWYDAATDVIWAIL